MNIQMLTASAPVLTQDHMPFETIGDALSYGLPLSLFGFAVVFSILVILWGVLSVFRLVFARDTKPKAPKAKLENKQEKKIVAAPVAQAAPVSTAASDSDSELVAVITAAISAYRSMTGGSVGGFRVVSFKKRK